MKFKLITDLADISIDEDVILIPILQDPSNHRCENEISFIYVYCIDSKIEYIINVSHYDYDKTLNLKLIKQIFKKQIYVYNKSNVFNFLSNSLDVGLLHWIEFNEPLEILRSTEISLYHKWYTDIKNINNIIPMMLWITHCRNIRVQCLTLTKIIPIDEAYSFYNMNLLNNLYMIENSGLTIDPILARQYINKSVNKLYCQYNLYTSTGRPSNHFNNINFAALNKSTGIRGMIIPSSDYLIEYDYDSMHVRLAANLISFDLPGGNLHEYFGRFYFKTPVLGEDNYVKSKNITWQLLYGNINNEYLQIPFFKAIHAYRNSLWSSFVKNGYIEMPLSKRKIKRDNFDIKMTPNILFNYLLQGYETEYNSLMLMNIFKYLYKKKSKLILYTYDSFLFDYDKEDGKQFLDDIGNILNKDNLRSSIKFGKNYHNMKEYNGHK